jgi:RimJ/RimL family protein N-acetyltransferase
MVEMFANMSKEALQYGLPPYDRTRLERWVSGSEGGFLLLALDGIRVVGAGIVSGRQHPRCKGIGEFAIYLHQDCHNQGLGTFLTKTILQEAKSRGFHRVGLHVVADNVPAIKAYERAGFSVEGRFRDAFFGDDGRYHDQLAMGVLL